MAIVYLQHLFRLAAMAGISLAMAACMQGSLRDNSLRLPLDEVNYRIETELGALPFAGLERGESLGRHRWSLMAFYEIAMRARDGAKEFFNVARRVDGDLGGRTRIQWADSRDCPALSAAIHDLQHLRLPEIETPEQRQSEELLGIYTDGTSYRVWTNARFNDGGTATGTLELVPYDPTGPVYGWANDLVLNLDLCWKDSEPHL